MRGYLKNAEGIFQLAPKVTTVGREGCDLVVNSLGVDFQHAVIEYSEQEDCYVLQDLNTSQGTYVNECRVQNAAVRLAPGDIIRFGYGGVPYELQIESPSQYSVSTIPQPQPMAATNYETKMAYPPVHQRPLWTQPLTVIGDPIPPQVTTNEQGLPSLRSVISTTTSQWGPQQQQQQQQQMALQHQQQQSAVPRPPTTLRSRPLSAGSLGRRPNMDRPQLTGSPPAQQRSVTGWVGGHPGRSVNVCGNTQQQNVDLMALQEKEQRIFRLSEEVRRLKLYETECSRREDLIQQMRGEVADLQGKLRQNETMNATRMVSTDADLTGRLLSLEQEVQLKTQEVENLRDQISQMRAEDLRGSPISRQDFNDRVMEINSLRTEVERTRKDKNITAGLVTQMQRDMTNKDTTISRLSREIENLKIEIKDKEVQISSLQSKFRKTQESKRSDEENEAKDKELASLRQKFKSTESQVQQQTEVITALKEEMEKTKTSADDDKDCARKLQSEVDQAKARSQDMERAERLVRVDLEQLSKRLERFRSRVLQVTFSTPNIKAPETEITDDELLETLKALIDERTDMTRKVQDMNDVLNQANSSKKEMLENSKKLKQQLNESVTRLRERGMLTSRLKQELDLIQAVSVGEIAEGGKGLALQMLEAMIEWESQIEAALEECGINMKLSEEAPATHIVRLQREWQESSDEKSELRRRMDGMEEQHRNDLGAALENLHQEYADKTTDAVEKALLESEEKMNRAIDEIRALETEKREGSIEAERAKIAELEVTILQLKESVLETESEQSVNKETTKAALEELESLRTLEAELKSQIEALTNSSSEETQQVVVELEERKRKFEEDATSYKEQIRQHSVTICAMEERLNKVMKKNKDYQAEMTHLKKTIQELKSKQVHRPTPPPKPKVIIQHPAQDAVIMEQTVAQLQRENVDYKRTLQEQQDVILGLRRDLAGTAARLSDMRGELSEGQKEEMERKGVLLKQQEAELVELRQQMAKLSHIVDKQTAEMNELNSDLGKQKTALSKYKNCMNDRESKITELESLLSNEQEESKKHLALIEDEGRITSELTAQGAQCRGDRHEQVIARQREALTELRARIKSLEQTRPPIPTQDQALQQVILLKKELAELRAVQSSEGQSCDPTILEQQINKARGLDPQMRADAEIERSAHRETLESLELSESTFLTLLRGIASSLEMDSVGGLRSMAHIPHDERSRLASEREQAVEQLTSRVRVLKERIQRKDELLQGYERDLAKLRQAEQLAEQKHSQVESLSTDVRSRTEESQYLRESLQRTKDRLEQEKRLNSAIKHKKAYHLDNEKVVRNGWPRHQCPPDDIHGRSDRKKRAQVEKMKRKNYEIRTLKDELGSKEHDLQDARRRLVTMETTLGVETDRDPFEPPALEI